MKPVFFKQIFIAVIFQMFFTASVFGQKYTDGTRLLKGAEVLSATPLQLDYVLEKLADTAKITVNLHEGKTHLVLDDGSGKWREWWYYMGKWQVKTAGGNDGSIPEIAGNTNALLTKGADGWVKASENITLMEEAGRGAALLSQGDIGLITPTGDIVFEGPSGGLFVGKDADLQLKAASDDFQAWLEARPENKELSIVAESGEGLIAGDNLIEMNFKPEKNEMTLISPGLIGIGTLHGSREDLNNPDSDPVHTIIMIQPQSDEYGSRQGIILGDQKLKFSSSGSGIKEQEEVAFVSLGRKDGITMESGQYVLDSKDYTNAVRLMPGEGIRLETDIQDEGVPGFAASVKMSRGEEAVTIAAGRNEGTLAGNIDDGGAAIRVGIDAIEFSSDDSENGYGYIAMPSRIYYQAEEPVLDRDGFAFWVKINMNHATTVNAENEFYLILRKSGGVGDPGYQKKIQLQ